MSGIDRTSGRDFQSKLYPFQHASPGNGEVAIERLLTEVRASTLQKANDIAELRGRIAAEYSETLADVAIAMAAAFVSGGKLLAFGNGGSATDAQDAAADCMSPPVAGWKALPALALVNDVAVVTGVANDVGFENVFLRQVIAFGERGDIALGFTTSGGSPSVVQAFAEARRRGMLSVALTGYDGGVLAREGVVDFCLVARAEHIPRIQEGHATLWHALIELVQAVLADSLAHSFAGSPAGAAS